MPDINIGQQGKLKSTPKLTRINGDDALALIYRNMGNNHAYPFVWAEQITLSGTEELLLASGTKFHGMEAADYCKVVATPAGAPSGSIYVDSDTTAKTVKIKSTASESNLPVNVMVMVGIDPDVEAIACRGNTGAAQSLP